MSTHYTAAAATVAAVHHHFYIDGWRLTELGRAKKNEKVVEEEEEEKRNELRINLFITLPLYYTHG